MKILFCCLSSLLMCLLFAFAPAEVASGSMITFGCWHQDADAQDNTPIEWRVLEVQEDRVLLLSDMALDARPYDLYRVDAVWENCTLRAWLNTEFLNEAFTPDEQKAILVTTLDNGAECLPTEDKMFLLNYSEGIGYLSPEEFTARYTRYAARKDGMTSLAFSWTRESRRMINMGGTDCYDLFQMGNNAVRPAMWVSLPAMNDPAAAPNQDFTPPAVAVMEMEIQETPPEGTVYRCLLLRGPLWSGLNAQYCYKLTELMPDETVFYPAAGFPELSGSEVRTQLDRMAQLADDDDVTYIVVATHGEPEHYTYFKSTDYYSDGYYQGDLIYKTDFVEKLAAIEGRVIVLSLSCYSGTLADYCSPLDPDRYTVWMSCGNDSYPIGSTEEKLYKACKSVRKDDSHAIELKEISAFNLTSEGTTPCVYGNPDNFVFPVKK